MAKKKKKKAKKVVKKPVRKAAKKKVAKKPAKKAAKKKKPAAKSVKKKVVAKAKKVAKKVKAKVAKKVAKAKPKPKVKAKPVKAVAKKAKPVKAAKAKAKAAPEPKEASPKVGATKEPPAPLKIERRIIENPEPTKRVEAYAGDLFTDKELDMFKNILKEERAKILAQARKAVESGGIQFDSSDLMDEVDQASAMESQNLNLRLLDRDRKLLSEIDHAISKTVTGDFGYCEGTGEPIPRRRLELRPWTRHSVKYKEKLERMKKSGRGVVDEDEA
jgi:DnaK suppressor protein